MCGGKVTALRSFTAFAVVILLALQMPTVSSDAPATDDPAGPLSSSDLLALADGLCDGTGDDELDLWWDEAAGIRVHIHSLCAAEGEAADEDGDLSIAQVCSSTEYSLQPYRWVVPYRAYYNLADAAVDSSLALRGAREGAQTWQDEVLQPIYLQIAVDSTGSRPAPVLDDENVHAWVSLDSNTLGTAVTWYYPPLQLALESDIVYNKDMPWEPSNEDAASGKFNYVNTALHELGHTFGMGHTSQASHNRCLVMYPFSGTGEARQSLGTGDRLGIQDRY